jgi:hypothetical protein
MSPGRHLGHRTANRVAADLAPVITELRQAGVTSLKAIAKALDERHVPPAGSPLAPDAGRPAVEAAAAVGELSTRRRRLLFGVRFFPECAPARLRPVGWSHTPTAGARRATPGILFSGDSKMGGGACSDARDPRPGLAFPVEPARQYRALPARVRPPSQALRPSRRRFPSAGLRGRRLFSLDLASERGISGERPIIFVNAS